MADLDPRFSFENFVVGPANRLASSAARRAAESPGTSYNPLFLYAASGLGKTHILGAVARLAEKVHPERTVAYQTLEGFLGELADSLAGGEQDGARGRYGSVDVLLMDDVQFLAGQSEAQEMLLRLLDALTGDGKQVVLASDRPPSEIDKLDARLRSRFEGGLLVDIGPPEFETRVAIIRKRADAQGQKLSQGVAEVIGRVAFRNVRELTGALNRILAVQELEGRTVSPQEAASLVGEDKARALPGQGGKEDLGRFLEDLSDTVAAQVERQEAPWRRLLREVAEEAEEKGFKADRLRRLIERDAAPRDLDHVIDEFRTVVERLGEIRTQLDQVGNPWPEAAHGVLRDPERLEEAEALLASARERARPFPPLPEGPGLEELGDRFPPLVLRAAEQLIGSDRPEYNPLYVWCHEEGAARELLEAAGRTHLAEHPEARVAFISVSGFAEDFIGSLSGGVAGAWRERWWSAELLLVHSAQELTGTERAQDEFFHLFEALQRRRARIMVAADRPPARMARVDDRIRSRFEGGLVLELEPPPSRPRVEIPAAGEGEAAEADTPPQASEGAGEPPLPTWEETAGGSELWTGLLQSAVPGWGEFDPALETRGAGTETETGEIGSDAAGAEGRSRDRASERDVAALDREWIMALTAAPGVRLGKAVSDADGRGMAGGLGRGGTGWFPSPERVVWEWPRLEERLVEEPD